MAIGGGATSAYKVRINAFQLETTPTTYLGTECATVDTAMEILERGETCIVAAGDMARLRKRLESFGIR